MFFSHICGAICVAQSTWCKLCVAIYVVQTCGAFEGHVKSLLALLVILLFAPLILSPPFVASLTCGQYCDICLVGRLWTPALGSVERLLRAYTTYLG